MVGEWRFLVGWRSVASQAPAEARQLTSYWHLSFGVVPILSKFAMGPKLCCSFSDLFAACLSGTAEFTPAML